MNKETNPCVPSISHPFREVIEAINNAKDIYGFSEGNNIILSTLTPNKYRKKQITSLSELKKTEKNTLVEFVTHMLESGRSIGVLPYKDDLDEVIYVIEIIEPPREIVILGAGHVGRSLAILASTLEFNVSLIDDREEFLTDTSIGSYDIRRVTSSFSRYLESVAINTNSAIAIVTRGHQFDEICLSIAIRTSAKYIGMIGSKRRVSAIVSNLKQSTLTKQELVRLDNIYAPIGLDIGAKSPQEIAISILAQIIQVMNHN
jgi:xanthine/CO dehydrogenase XdhC/CoxF family maturation factor